VRREKYVILFYLYSDPITKLPNIPHNVWRTEFCGLSEKQKLNDTPLEVRKGIKWAFAEYIHRVKAEFPFKKSKDTEDDIRKLFLKFVDKSTKNEIQYNFSFYLRDEEGEPLDPPVERSSDIDEKFDYKYKYKNNPLGVINKSHAYNKVSDYFQEENRMDCGSNSVDSPLEIWYNKDKLAQMNWHWFRKGAVGTCNIDEKRIRSGFRLGTYIATQFRPMAAKTIFDKYEAVNVVDTSCGWGDRLAGFYASKSTKLYVGCDPNPAVFKAYKEQCKFYEETLEGKLFEPDIIDEEKYFELRGVNKTVKIWNLPSEDVDWSQYHDTFDLYFSSPPYFDTEKYGQGKDGDENQSWSRYQTFEKWKKFFFGVTKKVCKTLQPNGKMLINIIEPRTKKGTRHNLCDNMVDYLTSETNCDYEGKLGLRMMGRPNSELKEYRNEVGDVIGYGKPGLQGCVIEPIWVFKNEVRKV